MLATGEVSEVAPVVISVGHTLLPHTPKTVEQAAPIQVVSLIARVMVALSQYTVKDTGEAFKRALVDRSVDTGT